MTDNDDDEQQNQQQQRPKAIYLTIPPRLYQVPLTAVTLGCAIGIMRGGRAASLRFLAENAHRPPKTVQGWYFYKKTKNYRVMLGALKGAGKEAGRLGLISLGFVGVEEGVGRLGEPWSEGKEVAAGAVTAAVFSAIYRLSVRLTVRTVGLGLGMGLGLKMLNVAREQISGPEVDNQNV